MQLHRAALAVLFALLVLLQLAAASAADSTDASPAETATSAPSTTQGTIDRFMTWLTENEATVKGIEVSESSSKGGLGVVATEALPSGTVFASLPMSLLLSIEHVFTDPFAQEHLERLSDTDAMAAYLARMRVLGDKAEVNAQWAAWVALLPDSFPMQPLFYTPDQMEHLQSSSVRAFTARRLQRAHKAFASLAPAVRELVTFERFLWGLSVLWSRTHGVRIRDGQGVWHKAGAFVPLADLLNMPSGGRAGQAEAEGGAAVWEPQVANADCLTNNASTHFECHTTRAVQPGEELLVPYGAASASGYSNGQLLLDYAFAVERNPHDVVQVELPALRRSGEYEAPSGQRAELSGSTVTLVRDLLRVTTGLDAAPDAQVFSLRALPASLDALPPTQLAAQLPASLLVYLRLYAVDDALLARLGGESRARDSLMGRLRQGVPLLGPEPELAALALLAATVPRMLERYPTSLAADEQRLEELQAAADSGTGIQGPHQRLEHQVELFALHVRMGEKRILQAHVELVQRYKDALDQQIANAKAAAGGEDAEDEEDWRTEL